MKILGRILLGICISLATTPAFCTGIYKMEIVRGGTLVSLTSGTDTVVLHISSMTLGDYDCSGNGGFDQSGGPPGTISHIKAGISATNALTGGHAAGKSAIQVPFNSDGTYVTLSAGTWRLTNTTDAYLILNAIYGTPDGTTGGFGYLQCVGPQ